MSLIYGMGCSSGYGTTYALGKWCTYVTGYGCSYDTGDNNGHEDGSGLNSGYGNCNDCDLNSLPDWDIKLSGDGRKNGYGSSYEIDERDNDGRGCSNGRGYNDGRGYDKIR